MRDNDAQIREILARYGEDFQSAVWRVQGQAVIYHKALERIAAQQKIMFDAPSVLRAERDEAVILVTGRMGARAEWSVGEAIVNVNYRVSGRQAAYVWAMAEKRAKDRVILKLIGLHGLLYSEEEADEFKSVLPEASDPAPSNGKPSNGNRISAYQARKDGRWEALVSSLRACGTIDALKAWHDEHEGEIGDLPQLWKDELREEYAARYHELRTR